jgi:16S rRNA (guanine966-N2)-methyltransferase
MRIISGNLKGRKLKTPKNYEIRPTSDRVKEAIFSMLTPYITNESVVVDLFSGTGNLGLEAISRGAKTVYFSDASKESIALVKENIAYCGVSDNSVLLLGDYRQNLKRIREKVDIILLDPPYMKNLLQDALEVVSSSDLLTAEGIVVCEHSSKETLPDTIGNLTTLKTKRYGSIKVTLYYKD